MWIRRYSFCARMLESLCLSILQAQWITPCKISFSITIIKIIKKRNIFFLEKQFLGCITFYLPYKSCERIRLKGFELNVFLGSSLITLYARSTCNNNAWCVFDKMPKKGLCYVECCAKWFTYCNKALDLFLESNGVLNSMEIFGSTKICKWICFMSFGF